MTRVYTLQDVLGQLNQDSQVFIDSNPDEPVNQFMQGEEVLKFNETHSFNDWTPYPWLVANFDGPTGLWLLGDPASSTSAFDSTPYLGKNFGTVPGSGVTFGGVSPINGATSAAFTSANTGIATPANYSIAAGQSWTIEAWVKPTGAAPTTIGRLIDFESTPTRNGLLFFQTTSSYSVTGAIQLERWVNGASTTSVISATLSTINWTHAVGVYDGATLRLYINGSQVASSADATAWISATPFVQMGTNLAGSMYGCAIYPVALSSTQVAAHYAWGTATTTNGAYTYGFGSPTKYGWFTYPNPPSRGSNRWGSAIWNNASFTWG
jgi:hypothetical protein